MENVVYRYYKMVDDECLVKISQHELDTQFFIYLVSEFIDYNGEKYTDVLLSKSNLRQRYFELRDKGLYEQAKLRIENLIEEGI